MDLLSKIKQRSAIVSVIGLGMAGLPLAVAFAKAGFKVVGIDIDEERVKSVKRGRSYMADVSDSELSSLVFEGRLTATADYSTLREADAICICVPTPLSESKGPDLSHIVAATKEIAKYLHRDQLIVLESTTYPGTTEEVVLPLVESDAFKVGRDFYLAFSPERIDPGNKIYTVKNTPKIIGGVTPKCLAIAKALYESALDTVIPVSSTRSAEMVKLLENTFRAVNIALANEVAIMCDKLGLDVWEIIEAAATKPFGFMPFRPGPGLGGHCIPIAPHYLSWKLRTLGHNARFVQLADEINSAMPLYLVNKAIDALNEEGKSVEGSRILVLGVAYKKNVSDTRSSPALDIIRLLKSKGAQVSYNDPYVPSLELDGEELKATALTEESLSQADCLVIATDHDGYDWAWIVENAKLIVDGRNATKALSGKARIIKL